MEELDLRGGLGGADRFAVAAVADAEVLRRDRDAAAARAAAVRVDCRDGAQLAAESICGEDDRNGDMRPAQRVLLEARRSCRIQANPGCEELPDEPRHEPERLALSELPARTAGGQRLATEIGRAHV